MDQIIFIDGKKFVLLPATRAGVSKDYALRAIEHNRKYGLKNYRLKKHDGKYFAYAHY